MKVGRGGSGKGQRKAVGGVGNGKSLWGMDRPIGIETERIYYKSTQKPRGRSRGERTPTGRVGSKSKIVCQCILGEKERRSVIKIILL